MQRITPSQVRAVRLRIAADQGNKCALCGQPLGEKTKAPVLDHCHTTGEVRGVLHRGCNSLLGKIENGLRIYGLHETANLSRFLHRVLPYMFEGGHGMLYPTHRTDDEKRELRNKRARAKRAKEKA